MLPRTAPATENEPAHLTSAEVRNLASGSSCGDGEKDQIQGRISSFEINETRAVGTSLSLHLSCVCLLGSLASSLPPPSFLAKTYQLQEPQEQNPQDPPIWAPAMTVAGPQPDFKSGEQIASSIFKNQTHLLFFRFFSFFSFNGDRRAVKSLLSKILSFPFT